MNFFIPHAENEAQAERVLGAICKFVGSPIPQKRVQKIRFSHNEKEFVAEVGKRAPSYYHAGDQEVIAIIPDSPYKICLPYRGVVSGEPILVGDDSIIELWFFD